MKVKERLQKKWFSLPTKVRKPVALFVGLTFVITAGLIGWLPGPGGIPLFLVGVAILATEYSWAERFKRFILHYIRLSSTWLRERPALMWLIVSSSVVILLIGIYELTRRF